MNICFTHNNITYLVMCLIYSCALEVKFTCKRLNVNNKLYH